MSDEEVPDATASPFVRAAGVIDLTNALQYLAEVVRLFKLFDIFTVEGMARFDELTLKYFEDIETLLKFERDIMESRRR